MKREHILLILILLTGTWLRFYHLGEISFSNDELSAITRARVDSFHELVEKGIKTDGHPALAETLIWLVIHYVGDDVFTIRFLFALSGVISILLIYLLAKRWFGTAAALLSAAALSILQFPVLYSQLARPYALGLMFTLSAAYFWTKILFDNQKNKLSYIAYAVSIIACIYTHYFSFMMAGIIGLSGLFFLKKNNFLPYLLSNLIAVLLFIPHIAITKFQLGYGGLGWLSAPPSNFLSLFIRYGFNDSQFVFYLFAVCLLVGAIIYSRKDRWKKIHSLCVLWYLIPFAVGYYYSTHKAPVLQYSTLLFSFPFLLIFTFSFIKEEWLGKAILSILTVIVLTSGAYSTVIEKRYYTTNHFGVFKELAEKVVEWNKKYGKENVTTSVTLSNPEYLNYYFRILNHNTDVTHYTSDERNDFGKLSNLLDTCSAEYFAYGWTNWGHEAATLELIQEKYPEVAERDTFFNSEITLFKKGNRAMFERLLEENDFEIDKWEKKMKGYNGEISRSGKFSQKMDEKTEYSATFHAPTDKLKLSDDEVLKAEVWFNALDSLGDAALVISVGKKGETVLWQGMSLKYFFNGKNKWQRVVHSSPVVSGQDNELAVYVWNPDKKTFYIDDFRISATKRNALYRP